MLSLIKNAFPVILVMLLSLLLASFALAADEGKLPAPQGEGGMGLFSALKNRASAPGADFPSGQLANEELSTILWAASGLNRGNSGWTVPMARGREPYCRIYVADDQGVFLYNWKEHSLQAISRNNIKSKIGAQGFVKMAPCILIIVSDTEALAYFKDDKTAWEFAQVLTGAMTQNIYLAAANYNIGARYIHSMRIDEIKAALRLPAGDEPICLMMLGK